MRSAKISVMGLLLLVTACDAGKKLESNPARIACPSRVSESTRLDQGIYKSGVFTSSEKILYQTGLDQRMPGDTVDPAFSEEHIDEWDLTPEGAVAVWDYDPGKHNGMYLRCDYFPIGKYDGREGGYQKVDGRVTLRLPLPDPPGLKCTFTRNSKNVKYSASCDLDYAAPAKLKED